MGHLERGVGLARDSVEPRDDSGRALARRGLERLISSQGKKLDARCVRRWMVDTMGEDDERVKKWDELCAAFWRDAP